MSLHSKTRPASPPRSFTFLNNLDAATDMAETTEDENGECMNCGSISWSSVCYGSYSQIARFEFNEDTWVEYDNMETERISDPEIWECSNGHIASETIAELIMNHQ